MESPRRNMTNKFVPKLLPTGCAVADADAIGCGVALADGVESTTAEYVNV
jgi:hypothetical protein